MATIYSDRELQMDPLSIPHVAKAEPETQVIKDNIPEEPAASEPGRRAVPN